MKPKKPNTYSIPFHKYSEDNRWLKVQGTPPNACENCHPKLFKTHVQRLFILCQTCERKKNTNQAEITCSRMIGNIKPLV